MTSKDDPDAACPVDHKARAAWLQQATAQGAATSAPAPASPHTPLHASCDSASMDQNAASPPSPSATGPLASLRLGTEREVSTIPRAVASPADPKAPPAPPANKEGETGSDKSTGNWIYPSEKMFFDAMKRKSYDPQETDMKTIVPIHNAVNERAWTEIRGWEAGRGSDACGGPRLESFSGLSSSLSPRARFNTLLGYQPPFDRHDWVVDRCGTKIEYVIDFYAGKNEKRQGKELSFYLDVRPKLNSWEAIKTRVSRFWGL